MTPSELLALIPPGAAAATDDPTGLLAALESAWDADPRSASLRRAHTEAWRAATASDGLPAVVADVRRERLIRWDAQTVTFDGSHQRDGRPWRVRCIRGAFARDSVVRRALIREGATLRACVDGMLVDEAAATLSVPIDGAPIAGGDDLGAGGIARGARAIQALSVFEAAGLALAPLDREEVREVEGGVRIVTLSLGEHATSEQIARIARWLVTDGVDDSVIEGFATFPPASADEALSTVRAALRDRLLGRFFALDRRAYVARHGDRRSRLLSAVVRLGAGVAPPRGKGAISVDLDGRTTCAVSQFGRVSWGPVGGDSADVLTAEGELQPLVARRLLRARAAAPNNDRLHAEVNGSARFVDELCRWLAAALDLRTTRLLLEAQSGREP